MNGRKAKLVRRICRGLSLSREVEHHNIRTKTVKLPGRINPYTGLVETVTFTYTTSTQVIPARRVYRAMKRALGRRGHV